jgi:hypothetical protein
MKNGGRFCWLIFGELNAADQPNRTNPDKQASKRAPHPTSAKRAKQPNPNRLLTVKVDVAAARPALGHPGVGLGQLHVNGLLVDWILNWILD